MADSTHPNNPINAQIFHCPSCGAPLIPKGAAAVMSCSYCNASVAVPEELRQVAGAAAWSTLIFDDFSSNDNNWLVGETPSDDYFTQLSQTIADRRYRWKARVNRPTNTSSLSSMATAWLRGYSLSDFHLLVNCKHILGSRSGSSWGLIFRVQDNKNMYSFRMSDQQLFSVLVVTEGNWQKLLAWERSETIKAYGVNQLEVIANAAHFTFLINGRVVGEVDDDHFSKGLVGMVIEGYTHGEETTFDFLDLTLRAP